MSTEEEIRVGNLIKLKEIETLVDKYIASVPKTRKTKDRQLEEIEKGMNEIKGNLKANSNEKLFNKLIDKLDRYENSDLFKEVHKDKVVKPEHKLKKIDEESTVKERVEAIEERIGGAGGDVEEIEERKEGEDLIFEPIGSDTTEVTTEEEEEEEDILPEEKEEEEVTTEEEEDILPKEDEEAEISTDEEEIMPVKEEERVEIDEEAISPEMEEFHNQIRKDERERVIKEFNIKTEGISAIKIDNEDKIDIPKERLGTEGKSVKILNDDIKYFLKRFPDLLKLERNVYNKSDKKDRKLLVDIHRRIQAKLSSPEDEEKSKGIGIILDADAYIDSKINELLARKTLEGLTPANLVDITKEPKSKGKDVGSYTLTKMGGRDVVQNAPVYRAIPSTSDEAEMEEDKEPKEAKINQSTIYKNSGKTKVDIAKMELNTNPFIRRTRPQRLNIIL